MKGLSSKLFLCIPPSRCYITSKPPYLHSKSIRQEFLKFFIEKHDHKFIKSSPVVPFCDPSVPFVNAGMNQFKGVFLGQQKSPCTRATNSQKCIRVGGKHNDLENVGNDGYHHTFFEMMGNWSFGDYFKEKACSMAWELLVLGPYKLDPSRLYVTYFGGDYTLGIEPDLETRDIWLRIGVPQSHILPFGSEDNFWEMGPSGPCGPCTEIHYDHEEGRKNGSNRVNQGFEDLVEVWNLVFIQYNRGLDGTLHKLPNVHVDTGMGLERLVAILQGKRSNYETDLFTPLFTAIQKLSGCPEYKATYGQLDTHYRILADHARMVTVAIADGVFPDQNVKLRRVLRRALDIAKNTFGSKKELVSELTNHVAESLADAYPEIGAKLKQIQMVIRHEENIVTTLHKSVLDEWKSLFNDNKQLEKLNVAMMPGIIGAFKELQKFKSLEKESVAIPGELSYKLFDTYGLDINSIQVLCNHFQLQVDVNCFQNILMDIRKQSRFRHNEMGAIDGIVNTVINYTSKHNILPTDDSFKYLYHKDKDYVFPPLSCKIEAIICNGQCVDDVTSESTCRVILNRTNLYHEAGGQNTDSGYLLLNDGTQIVIENIDNIQGFLLHELKVPKNCKLSVGDHGMLHLAYEKRLRSMCNHTATHLLNASLREILTVTCQKSSCVSDSFLMFEFAVFGENFNHTHVEKVSDLVHNIINSCIPIKRITINSQKLQELYISNNVTLVPGEIYPNDDIHVIQIIGPNCASREACCGTHVLNTADVGDFCITDLKSPNSGTRTLYAVTGSAAKNAVSLGSDLCGKVNTLLADVQFLVGDNSATFEEVEKMGTKLQNLKQDILNVGKLSVPYTTRVHCLGKISEMSKELRRFGKTFTKVSLEEEMQVVIKNAFSSETSEPYLVHFLKCSLSMDVPLQKATRMCTYLPVLIIAYSDNNIKARCCVPKEYISNDFNAKLWMEQVLSVFKSKGYAPRGQSEEEIFNMKKLYVKENAEALIDNAVLAAKMFARDSLSKR